MTAPKSQSWDQFWAEVSGSRTEVIRGVEVKVPTDMPLNFEERIGSLSDLSATSRPEDFEPLVSPLFGDGVFHQWYEAGMGAREFLTAVTWGFAQASGKDMSFAEAYELATGGDPGKALGNRQARRTAKKAASKQPSASTGGRSRPTSSGSTSSARRTSRG